MRKVIGIGETVMDIIFRNGQPVAATPGGSVFNGIVSLARSGASTTFIGEVGADRIGQRTIDFLRDNGVSTQYVSTFADSKSPVSLAFLNDGGDADYLFYKDHPHDRLDYLSPDINRDDIVMFGSYYAVNPVIRPQVAALLASARDKGAIIYYDVNFRTSHAHEVMKLTPNILENLEYADIVRGSHDDFRVLYKMDSPERVYNAEIAFYCKNFIYTSGAGPVTLRGAGGVAREYPVAATSTVSTVSTVGAGDNFNAGFIYGLLKNGVTHDDICRGIDPELWDRIVTSALEFSAHCCQRIDNHVDPAFGAAHAEALRAALAAQ